ncbi:MAG: squalene/phytoene synthase family protein [Corynebacterium sp.]|nr:squalene/phytoene synthase family protein [Corynebacterium sp.]
MNVSVTYLRASQRAAAAFLRHYSSSFGLASSFLSSQVSQDIHTLYAVVRIADEIVDGAATTDIAAQLQAYESQILQAPQHSFHTDPVVHAYAELARRISIPTAQMAAFFQAMGQDIQPRTFDHDDLAAYVYGSAEVIGLLCLRIFLDGNPGTAVQQKGARQLGNAFQIINFVRDIQADQVLGRNYFGEFDEAAKQARLTQAIADIDTALATTKDLPQRCVLAIHAAGILYRNLAEKLLQIPLDILYSERIRIPGPRKLQCVVTQLPASLRR